MNSRLMDDRRRSSPTSVAASVRMSIGGPSDQETPNCTLSWGITFSIKVSNRNSGKSCLSDSSMSTVCCSSDPSCPVIPGGASRIFEWSLHGGAAVESIIMLGSRCPLIFSASSLGSTSQMSLIHKPDPHISAVNFPSTVLWFLLILGPYKSPPSTIQDI